jgi:hypothetical protein
MRKSFLLIFAILIFSYGCKTDKHNNHGFYEVLIQKNKDSTYILENHMLLIVNSHSFEEDIVCEYEFPSEPSDFYSLTTQTKKGQKLVSFGMVNLKFKNSQGKLLNPKKPVKLICSNQSIPINSYKGIEVEGQIFWESIPKKEFITVCIPSTMDQVEVGPYDIKNGIQLSHKLNNFFLDSNILSINDSVDFTIQLDSVFRIKKFRWRTKKDEGIEKGIQSLVGSLKLSCVFALPRHSIVVTSKNLKQLNGQLNEIKVREYGWYNFDNPLIERECTELKIIKNNPLDEVKLLSKELNMAFSPDVKIDNFLQFNVPKSYQSSFYLVSFRNGKYLKKKLVYVNPNDKQLTVNI